MYRSQFVVIALLGMVAYGCPNPIPPGPTPSGTVVETGHGSTTSSVVLVNVDNPDIKTHLVLRGVSANNTDVNQEITADLDRRLFNNFNSDFYVNTTGGDATAGEGRVSPGGSVADRLLPWTDLTGDFVPGPDVFLDTHGARVGYTPLTIQLNGMWPNHTGYAINLPTTVQLDPNVLLVPVEAAVFVSDASPQVNTLLNAQLQYWDLVTSVSQTFSETYSNGDIEAVHRTWENWTDRAGTNMLYLFQNRFTPDSVWQTCGIQFRLVNLVVIHTDNDHVNPSNLACPIDGNQPLFQNIDTLMADPRHMAGTLRVVFMQACTCPQNVPSGETGREVGGTGGVACVSFNDEGTAWTPAHEIGHAFGLCDAYCSPAFSACPGDCAANCANGEFSLMCGAGIPSQHECTVARKQAATYASFWKR